ncbi:uncharacterized protein A1O9_04387 [Exophiala aquamarina CBS 119918]|uniref:Rhodopsin domain-containing protein n=1 Tax=Exophiala aquamarina CBS 119918 TaxID=1182545 RepID=A0A072PJP3_9EURO|nr:uncharacterized protein A1O9_04387 [Exophiala aquamarina CBS 119918]KEF59543.1 hypothetical protein A1O9_04387 [Exophiala aquamarina CBS 119918]
MPTLSPISSTAVALTVLSGCCVVARLFSRLAFVKHVGIDDCLIAIAWSASLGLAVVIAQCKYSSLRKRIIAHCLLASTGKATQVADSLETLLQESWSASLTYNLSVLFLKDSLLLQYLRFSIDRGYQRACWALGIIVTAYGVSALFVAIFSCQPISFSWDNSIEGGRCINFLTFWLFNASFNSATDIIICILPIPVLMALTLPRKQAIILTCLFLLGPFVCAASIARLVALYTATLNNVNDPKVLLWSTIEVNVGIICACIPSLRHPVTQLAPRIFAHRRKPSYGSIAQSQTSITFETKHSGRYSRFLAIQQDSLPDEASLSHNTNVIDFSYFGLDRTNDDNENNVSPTGSNLPTPGTPTSLMFDMESQSPVDTMTGMTHKPTQGRNKPLPQLPVPIMPAPVARPAGPRTPQTNSKVFAMRSHKVRYEPRTILPLACIPESHSPVSATRGCSQIGQPNSSLDSTTDQDESRIDRRERACRTLAPKVPPYVDPTIAVSTGGSSTTYGNIAPWDACPCPGSKTYSYEILGGPRALDSSGTRSTSRREKARREKVRNERMKRAEQERKDRENRSRPNGPREMG